MTWLLPTRGRVNNLRRFLNSAREMGTNTPGWVIVNRDDYTDHKLEYDQALALAPVGWEIRVVDADCYGQSIRAVWHLVKDDPWIGLVSDDLVPCSGNWDQALVRCLNGWNVVSSNDGWQAQTGDINRDRLHGAIAWSGELARAVGWIFPDDLRHIFHDNVWETLGRTTGCWQVRTDIMCKHLHEALEGIKGPTMDPESDLWKHDEAWFQNWMKTDMPACVEKIRAVMARYGVKAVAPDFTGIKLMIGTPCIDGRYESSYMVSLFQTFRMMESNGVIAQLAEEKFTADVALARNKIIGAFLRSDCTHLLTIDADMGWPIDAVIRLFHAKKDFVSIAGPKKRYPLQFAANYTDAHGNPINLSFDSQSGTMEVGEIGSAFCLITKAMAQKMIANYPELSFVGVTGETEFGLYNPMVTNGRYYSEDFAFCKRWRDIGGKVHFVPDVALSHTGSHTFVGAFSEVAFQNAQMKQAAE